MNIIRSLSEWQNIRRQLSPDLTLGFVPTMGNLHQGHVSLFDISRSENDLSVASIFVNPAQFNQVADFNNYPKTLEADFERLEQAGIDYCLLPDEKSIYPEGFRYQITETNENCRLEGLKRPGHFSGVLTVVMILLNLVKPHRSYFGEKDYQQYLIIRDMAKSFFLDTEVKMCPTIRESSGLAFSSRNTRLTPEERTCADRFATIFRQPQKSCADIIAELTHQGISIDYIEEHQQRRFAAVYIGDVRLIDNYAL